MALGASYATLADLKTRMQIPVSDTNDDARLTSALDSASRAIEQICQRQFNNAGTPSTRMFRPSSPFICPVDDIVDTSSLSVTVNTAPWSLFDMYEVDPLNGVVNGVPGWPIERLIATQSGTFLPIWPRKATVAVTGVWGWAVVPGPVHEATLIGAEELAKLKDMPFGIGGYGDFGIVKVRDNPFVCRLTEQYQLNPFLVA